MSENNESAGAQLRRERERQGLTIQKVADDLRLDRTVVEALEDDSYTQTVPTVYSKGHLRKYYRLLGLTFDEDTGTPPTERGATTPTPLAPPTSPTRRDTRAMRIAPRVRKLPWAKIGIAAAIIAILLLFWWSPWKHRVTVQAATARAAPSPAGSLITVASEPAATEALPADTPIDAAAAAERVNLRLTFAETTWVDVRDAGGRRLFVGIGRAGTIRTLAGRPPLHVHVGLARGVRVAIDEHEVPIDPAFVKGDVARFAAGADGTLRSL